MANWYGATRSNYFRVKDVEKFKARVATLPDVTAHEAEVDPKGVFCLLSKSEDGSWPSVRSETDEEIDLLDELAEHLAKGEVAVLMECGHEKLRFLTGWANAVDWRHDVVTLNLDDIYKMAAKTFRIPRRNITEASY